MNKTAEWKRHTLVWLTEEGRRYAADHVHTAAWEEPGSRGTDSCKRKLICDHLVPGIICRQPSQSGSRQTILAGFSHWKHDGGTRLRTTAEILKESVWNACTPFDLCAPDQRGRLCTAYPLLEAVFEAADKYKIQPGLFGSTALEWMTGYPYRNRHSDLDLCLMPLPGCDLERFGRALSLLETQNGTRLDAELEVAGGYGIKLKELLSPAKTVMGKGLYDVVLFEKKSISDILPTETSKTRQLFEK